ncbi:MAG: Hsp20/alpha crystallin family protein [Actinobacteria bacterium HGW-Actinobacteria-7]|nr:MAG: Hsp20/alpha crystallin family protein [Actinobacteria bacterium HGW-Actinobacteria-7]
MTLLMRRDPLLRDAWGIQRDLDRLMSAFAASSPSTDLMARTDEFAVPSIDVIRRGEDLVFHAEMPGMKSEDIDISVAEGLLTVSGTRSSESTTEESDYLVRETSYGSFQRTLQLPTGLDPKSIQAEYRDGILDIVIPGAAKSTESPTVHIPVSTHTQERLDTHH